jgi:hypothetical protein
MLLDFLKDAFPIKFPGVKIVLTTETKTRIKIHSLKSRNESGYDRITRKIWKTCLAFICCHLAHIYNHSLHTGIFPDRHKMSVVKPLYKTNMTNNRLISLSTTFSEVLEKVMHSTVHRHMHSNNILVPEQFCFRKRISTQDVAWVYIRTRH